MASKLLLMVLRISAPSCHKIKPLIVQDFRRFFSSVRPSLAAVEQPIKIKTVHSSSKSGLSIEFDDHSSCNFKNIWLRDSCQCEECLHPVTKQKLLDPCSINPVIHPTSWNLDAQGYLQIDWSDGGLVHRSSYSPSWLHKFAAVFTDSGAGEVEDVLYSNTRKPSVEHWDQNKILQVSPEVHYKDFMANDTTLKRALVFIMKYGIAKIADVPAKKGNIVEVAKRMAYVRPTGYGNTFDVKYNPDPKTHLSYTGTRFDHHTDLAYRERSPGIQVLHCLQAADPNTAGKLAGGKSFFADGFFAANWLRLHHPKHFSILTTTPVLFTFLDSERGMWYREKWPVIEADEKGRLCEIHYSTFSMRAPLLEDEKIIPFYEAFRIFSQKLREDASQLMFYMKQGDLMIFNNRRIVHGRTEYNHHKVERYIEGCYMDLDELQSLYEKMDKTEDI